MRIFKKKFYANLVKVIDGLSTILAQWCTVRVSYFG